MAGQPWNPPGLMTAGLEAGGDAGVRGWGRPGEPPPGGATPGSGPTISGARGMPPRRCQGYEPPGQGGGVTRRWGEKSGPLGGGWFAGGPGCLSRWVRRGPESRDLVPEARLELAQGRAPGDFESPASTHSTTPASACILPWRPQAGKGFVAPGGRDLRAAGLPGRVLPAGVPREAQPPGFPASSQSTPASGAASFRPMGLAGWGVPRKGSTHQGLGRITGSSRGGLTGLAALGALLSSRASVATWRRRLMRNMR